MKCFWVFFTIIPGKLLAHISLRTKYQFSQENVLISSLPFGPMRFEEVFFMHPQHPALTPTMLLCNDLFTLQSHKL